MLNDGGRSNKQSLKKIGSKPYAYVRKGEV